MNARTPFFLRSLAHAPSSAIGRIAGLGRMGPSEYLIRVAAVGLLACSGFPSARANRAADAAASRKSRSVRCADTRKPVAPIAWRLRGPSPSHPQPSYFSALATWRSHPFFAQTSPRHLFPLQDLLHPIDLDRAHSPRFQIRDAEDKFEVVLELPTGMKVADVQIRVDEVSGGLSIAGKTQDGSTGYTFSSSFAQTFSLDPAVDASKMTATLDDNGILTVSAPKDPSRVHDRTRTIPVTATKAETEPRDESDDIESTKHEGIVEDKAA